MDAFEYPIGLPYCLFLRRPVNGGGGDDHLQQVHLASVCRVSIDIGQAAHCVTPSNRTDACAGNQAGMASARQNACASVCAG